LSCPLVVGSVAISYIQRARPGSDLNIFDVAKSWITAYFFMTMFTNVICSGELFLAHLIFCSMVVMRVFSYPTGAIAARIFCAWKSHPRKTGLPYWRIVVIMVESSALYALGVLATLISFVSGSNGQYPAVDGIVPLVVSRAFPCLLYHYHLLVVTFIRARIGYCILSHCDPNSPSRQSDRRRSDLLSRTYLYRDAIASKQ
jgi:hypothetical protein